MDEFLVHCRDALNTVCSASCTYTTKTQQEVHGNPCCLENRQTSETPFRFLELDLISANYRCVYELSGKTLPESWDRFVAEQMNTYMVSSPLREDLSNLAQQKAARIRCLLKLSHQTKAQIDNIMKDLISRGPLERASVYQSRRARFISLPCGREHAYYGGHPDTCRLSPEECGVV